MKTLKADVDILSSNLHNEFEDRVKKLSDEIFIKLDEQCGDKVRVDEVQDALRRLTDSFQTKIENIFTDLTRTVNAKSEDNYAGMQRLKIDISDTTQAMRLKVSQE